MIFMNKHLNFVKGYNGSLEELADAIGYMRYEQTSIFIEKLAANIKKQSDADKVKGRTKLSNKLLSCSTKLYEAKKEIDDAWNICIPFMKD